MRLESLKELFIEELRDLYSAESQILKALPRMANVASSPELKLAFNEHHTLTKDHITRLEKIFDSLDETPTGKVCKAMLGLIEEGSDLMDEEAEPEVRDAGLIASAQRIEHYEIAAYGTVHAYAKTLRHPQSERLLYQTLHEEMDTDMRLTTLAIGTINLQAAGG